MRTIDITRSDRPAPDARTSSFAFAALALLGAFLTWRLGFAAPSYDAVSSSEAGASAPADSNSGVQAGASAATARGDLTSAEQATVELFRRASPGVVHVTNVAKVAMRRSYEEAVRGSGSGFVWDREGHVVTNFHVVAGHDALYVRFAGDERPYRARVVNQAPHQDLAVLELVERPSEPLTPIPVGSSADLLVGQHVFAIGNPFGLDQTLSSGLISGLGREIRSVTDHKITGVIQTDAAINPGNSGGPLLDSRGRLIGVNTAIVTLSGAYNGIGFAVPVDTVRRIVEEILTTGKVTRPGLGVVLLGDLEAQQLGLRGVGIERVTDGSAAADAGLRSATATARGQISIDEIVRVDETVIRSARDLYDALDGRSVGDWVTLSVRRAGREFETRLRLQALRD